VSGRAFLGLIRHLRDEQGARVLDQIVQDAGGATQSALSQRVSKLGWYPYPAFTGFLHAAEATLPKVASAFQLGTVAGKRDLGTVLKIYVALSSPDRLIRSCKLVWPGYYRNAGRMEAVEWAPESTVLRIYDFPKMDRLHGRLMEGWMISTMESLGLRVDPGARQTLFMGDGAPHHEFRCSWRQAR
jgi:hypothetical protein